MGSTFPTSFGKYILLKPLARGGMGEIYLALTGGVGGFEKLCVIKRLRTGLQHDAGLRRFLDEAKVVVKLSHGNLVQVFDTGFVDDEIYMAMEYVEGRDLRDTLGRCTTQRISVPLDVALYVTLHVCRGLEYAHTYGGLKLVHRDICPSNVLVSHFGEVKVTDFGLAQSTIKEEKTAPGKIFGRFSYLSPEQTRHGEVDHRTDLYATTIILWEMLVGAQMRPGPHHDPSLAIRAVRDNKITPPSTRNPRVPAELDAIVMKGLQGDPERRYASAEEMRGALAKILARLNPTFDAGGIAAFMRQVYGEEIDAARQQLDTLLSANYEPFRRRSPSPPLAPAAAPAPTPAPPPASAPGKRLTGPGNLLGQVLDGRYRIIRLLGEGGMGAIYEAEHTEIGRRVAIKILHAIFCSHPETVTRFRAEARAATRIGHPNIVEVTDSGTTADGRVYFVMELLAGVDLAHVMAQSRIVPADRALNITRQVCKALHAAHEAGIVHRDMKPENIFLAERDGQFDFVKVFDFGIAKNVELRRSDDRLTHPGIAMGTPEYMAPEQAVGKNVDRRIDVYATGAILYEMLTGHLPHECDSMVEMLTRKTSDAPTPPRQFRPEIPEALEEVILRSLASDPAARFQTMEELGEALRPFLTPGTPPWESHPGSPAPPARTSPATPSKTAASTPSSSAPPTRTIRERGPLATAPTIQVRAESFDLPPDTAPGPGSPLDPGTDTGFQPARRMTWRLPVTAGLAAIGLVVAAVLLWPAPRATTRSAADAAVPRDMRTPDVRVRPDSKPPRQAPAKPRLSTEEAASLLEWARRAADGGRYLRPRGDNVVDLLDRVEEGYPGYPDAAKLRQDLCRKLERAAAQATRRKQHKAAERYLQAWMALDPLGEKPKKELVVVALTLGRQALGRNQLKDASRYAKLAGAMAPDASGTGELLGDIAWKRRKVAAAVQHYETALGATKAGKAQKRLQQKLAKARRKTH
jgi:serine/threonine protein kinase